MSESEIPRNLEFVPRNEHLKPSSCVKMKHNPLNGGSYNKNSGFIEFRLNNDGTFLKNAYLNCNFTVTMAAGGTNNFDVFSSPSINSCIRSLEIRQGSELIENVQDYNRIFNVYSRVYSSNSQMETGGSSSDLFQPSTVSGNWTTDQVASMGIKLNTSAAADPPGSYVTKKISVPLSLSNILGPSSHVAYPLALLGEPLFVRIHLTPNIEEVIHCYNTTAGVAVASSYGAASTYNLTDVNLEVDHVRYSPEQMKMILSNAPETLEYDGVQCISSLNTIGYSNRETVILPNTNYTDVRNVIINQWYPSLSSGQLNFGVSPLNGAFQSQLFLDGRVASNNRPIGSTDAVNVFNSNASYATSVLELNRPFKMADDTNTQLASTRWVSATDARYNFTVNNIGSGLGQTSFPSDPCTSVVPAITDFVLGSIGYAASPYFGYVGFDLRTGNDASRARVGVNCVGKQMSYEVRQSNTISSATTRCAIQGILSVGVKYVLDRRNKTLRTVY